MNPAAVLLRFLESLLPGPQPGVEKLPEPDAFDRLWEIHKLLFWVVGTILVIFFLTALIIAAWVFLPEDGTLH